MDQEMWAPDSFDVNQCNTSIVGLDLIHPPQPFEIMGKTKDQIRPLLIQMLKREDELRLHPTVQKAYKAIGDDETLLSKFTAGLQMHVSREFAVQPHVGIELIRSAISLFPGDEEIRLIPHYVRHNRCVEGHLKAGMVPPDCRVATMDGTERSLLEIIDTTKPVVLLAASHT